MDGFGINIIKTFLHQVTTTCWMLSYIWVNVPKDAGVSKLLGGLRLCSCASIWMIIVKKKLLYAYL